METIWELVANPTAISTAISAGFSTAISAGIVCILDTRREKKVLQLQAELNQLSLEHNVKFTRLHEKRAEAIELLNEAMWDAICKAEIVTNPFPWYPEGIQPSEIDAYDWPKISEWIDASRHLSKCVRKADIYFPSDIAKKLHEISESMMIARNAYLKERKNKDSGAAAQQYKDKLKDSMEKSLETYNSIHEHLREEFHKFLSYEKSDTKHTAQ